MAPCPQVDCGYMALSMPTICGLSCLNSSALQEPCEAMPLPLRSTYLIVESTVPSCGQVGSMLGTGIAPPPTDGTFGVFRLTFCLTICCAAMA